MTRALMLAALALLLLGCQEGGFTLRQGPDPAPTENAPVSTPAPQAAPDRDPAPGDAAAGRAADDAQAGTATDDAQAAPQPAPAVQPAPDTRAAARSEAQAACEQRGGNFVRAGNTGARVCQTRTRDSGKVCTASNQCEGACLARSATCAPVTPLLGCNDVITDNGGMATVCID